MAAIVLKKQINFGAILIDQISKWVEKAEKKPMTKVFHGRLLSIILKKKLGGEDQGRRGRNTECAQGNVSTTV